MEFVVIATAHFLALLSPGPDFFLILQAGLRLPLRYGVALCGGIATANGAYLLCAILGLEVLQHTPLAVVILRYAGAGYLIFLGMMLLRSNRQDFDRNRSETVLQAHHWGNQFVLGFMSGILNPKNGVFYLSLFTVMVSETTPLATRFCYGIWMASVVFFWDCGIVTVVGQKRIRTWLGQGVFYMEKVSGVMLAVFGILLPFT